MKAISVADQAIDELVLHTYLRISQEVPRRLAQQPKLNLKTLCANQSWLWIEALGALGAKMHNSNKLFTPFRATSWTAETGLRYFSATADICAQCLCATKTRRTFASSALVRPLYGISSLD